MMSKASFGDTLDIWLAKLAGTDVAVFFLFSLTRRSCSSIKLLESGNHTLIEHHHGMMDDV